VRDDVGAFFSLNLLFYPSSHAHAPLHPGIFEVVDASPPPRSLGEHPLPPDTHNGDRIEAAGGAWVVQRTALHYRLVRGRYVRHAARVEVVSAGRFLVERYLTGLMEMPGGGSESGGGGGGGGRERK